MLDLHPFINFYGFGSLFPVLPFWIIVMLVTARLCTLVTAAPQTWHHGRYCNDILRVEISLYVQVVQRYVQIALL